MIYAGKKIYAKNLCGWGLSPNKEELASLQESRNMQLQGMMVRKAVKAGRAGDWSEPRRSEELNPWMMAKKDQRTINARTSCRRF